MKNINVTKTFLPPLEEYTKHLNKLWRSGWVTNNGPVVQKLESDLKSFLQVKNLHAVTNATLGLQIALKTLAIKGEVITTPFSYVASTSAIVWEDAKPVFVDIDPVTLCIDPDKIEAAITKKTQAILAVHVYGIPCDVEKIEQIAKKHNLKVIYDAAHAFGVTYKNKSILEWGDMSVLSFHATKIFHTIEGGAIITGDKKIAHKVAYSRNFGHKGYDKDFYGVGINGKISEFHAAMGLCVLPNIKKIIRGRKKISALYDSLLVDLPVTLLTFPEEVTYNYAYYPIIFKNERTLLRVKKALNEEGIFPRRYFYPSLNLLQFVNGRACPIAESVSKRVLCLPLSAELPLLSVKKIAKIVASEV